MKTVANSTKSAYPSYNQADFFDGTAARKIEHGARIISIDRRSVRTSGAIAQETSRLSERDARACASHVQSASTATFRDDFAFSVRALGAFELLDPSSETVADHTLIKAAPSFSKLTAAGFLAFLATLFIIVISLNLGPPSLLLHYATARRCVRDKHCDNAFSRMLNC